MMLNQGVGLNLDGLFVCDLESYPNNLGVKKAEKIII